MAGTNNNNIEIVNAFVGHDASNLVPVLQSWNTLQGGLGLQRQDSRKAGILFVGGSEFRASERAIV
jgi:hypothetical protein